MAQRTITVLMMLLLLCSIRPAFSAEQVFYYHTDPVGTPLSMTDSTGNVVWKADYKSFGEEYTTTGTANNSKRFVGKEKDEETGLSYFGARYEDARTGRFIAVDPVQVVDPMTSKTNEKILLNPQRLNVYAYALNNPYRYVDTEGREPLTLAAISVSAFIINTLLSSDANAPEYRNTPTINSQTTGEFAAGVALAETGGFVAGRLTSAVFGKWAGGGSNSFFKGTKYSDKVLAQMKRGDFHAFPESVTAFEAEGTLTTIRGGDGLTRQLLKIPGEYGGKKGAFEFIKESDRSISHRLFRPSGE